MGKPNYDWHHGGNLGARNLHILWGAQEGVSAYTEFGDGGQFQAEGTENGMTLKRKENGACLELAESPGMWQSTGGKKEGGNNGGHGFVGCKKAPGLQPRCLEKP